jgi:hypothetical protein
MNLLHTRAANLRAKSGELRGRARHRQEARKRAELLELAGQYDEMADRLEEVAKRLTHLRHFVG